MTTRMIGWWMIMKEITFMEVMEINRKKIIILHKLSKDNCMDCIWDERESSMLMHDNMDGLVQDCSNSIANTLQLLQSCTKPST